MKARTAIAIIVGVLGFAGGAKALTSASHRHGAPSIAQAKQAIQNAWSGNVTSARCRRGPVMTRCHDRIDLSVCRAGVCQPGSADSIDVAMWRRGHIRVIIAVPCLPRERCPYPAS